MRTYLDRAQVRFVKGEKTPDRMLEGEVAALVRKGVPFDVFEVPSLLSQTERKKLAAELSRYQRVLGDACALVR